MNLRIPGPPHPSRAVGRLALFVVAACTVSTAFAVVADILPPARREASVKTALALAAAPKVTSLPAGLKNPFFPSGFSTPDSAELKALAAEGKAPAQAATPESETQILSDIAAWMNPSGTLKWGSTTFLLVGEKKLKVGDHLMITFKGHDYDVGISAIDGSSFSLRLNHSEITRPINTGTSP